MAIKDVDTKCYILALFVREDGERFLLGSGHYEFLEKQQHFAGNTMANDVIEVQGNDGYLLAGQVRRPSTQVFEGYVGDGTTAKTDVETYRRNFFKFFRKNFLYKVIYVFPDGSAIQRKRGFLVDAPTVQELYQIYPEYHVALNFEDINYYYYNENSEGEEIYGKSALIGLALAATGGLIWDNLGAVSIPYTWITPVDVEKFQQTTINNQLSIKAPITGLELYGDTFQQTFSGKNKWYYTDGSYTSSGIIWVRSGSKITGSGTATATTSIVYGVFTLPSVLPAGTYTVSIGAPTSYTVEFVMQDSNGTNHFDFKIPAGQTKFTYTCTYDIAKVRGGAGGWKVNDSINMTITNMQLESGNQATSYEPYTNGPAPNPDYPQDINVVTGEQTVTVSDGVSSQTFEVNLGKNLFDKSNPNVIVGTVEAGGYNASGSNKSFYLECESNTTYTIQKRNDGDTNRFAIATADTIPVQGTAMAGVIQRNNDSSITITTGNDAKYIVCTFYRTTESTLTEQELIDSIQVELGSTATPYAPYFTPIELCKIGNYQDYIYKSGDDWYVHKATGKSMLDEFRWLSSATNQTGLYRAEAYELRGLIITPSTYAGTVIGKSKYFTAIPANSTGTYGAHEGISANPDGTIQVYNADYNTSSSVNDLVTWFTTNNVSFYYALATPTDTQITDSTLIGQLEALQNTKLFVGTNTISASATSPNLPAWLKLSYYTAIDMTGAGYEWEDGGSGGIKIITVDSIDNVYPLLTITGPAVNPIITNITTGTVFKYAGTVSSSQTLKVDMLAKTATLNGTNVIDKVTDDWLYFTPGNNKVEYTTTNTDTPDALIEWQEIVG